MKKVKKKSEKKAGNKSQVKSRKRVEEHGEVFTAQREVKAMCSLVTSEIRREASTFFEPACGNGNFLIEILSRKLMSVRKKTHGDEHEYELKSLIALGSLYGIDIMADNVRQCRSRLYELWNHRYMLACAHCSDRIRKMARNILEMNIICGNSLTFSCVDENQQETAEPIVFYEWKFNDDDGMISFTGISNSLEQMVN